MSGHSKWHSIRHKKGAADAKRGKIFTRHANLITIAAREGGGDPDMNPGLRLAIDNAKKENVPNDNIDRAIKRGTGELKGAAEISEEVFEGYGPEGVALVIEALTDNKMRTYTNVKTALNKNGGKLADSGSVMYQFNRKGVITIEIGPKSKDEIQLAAIESGAEDIETDDNYVTIYTDPSDLTEVTDNLKANGIEIDNAERLMVADQNIEITDKELAEKIIKLVDAIEDDPDVSNVHGNFDIGEEIMNELE